MKSFDTILIKLHHFWTRLKRKEDLIHITGVLSEPGKILLVPESGIVDVLLTVPIAEAIKKIHRNSQLAVVVPFELMELLKGVKAIDHLVECDERNHNPFKDSFREVVKRITSEGYDIAIDVSRHLSYETALLVGYSGAKVRLGFHKPEITNFYNFAIQSPVEQTSYDLLMNRLLGPLGVRIEFRNLDFHLSKETIEKGTLFLNSQNLQPDMTPIGFFPDMLSMDNGLKDSHLIYFLKETKKIGGIKVVMAQTKIQQKVIERVVQEGGLLVPKGSIMHILSVLSSCKCVVTNNPGVAMFLSAVKQPVIYFGSEENVSDIPGVHDSVSFVNSGKKEELTSKVLELSASLPKNRMNGNPVVISAV